MICSGNPRPTPPQPYNNDPYMPDSTSIDPTTSTLTLQQFAGLISSHINSVPQLTGRWVIAEIARIGMSGPHCYCELIEKDSRGATVARMRGTIWSNAWRQIAAKFYAATGKQISGGMKVMFRMSATHAPAYGLSANIVDVDPAYTLGDAERRRREILDMLRRQGIIDLNKKLSLTPAPQKIAVISAAAAAGYGDFINQLDNSGFTFYPLLFPAAMQGTRTASSVIEALDRVEMSVDFWDAVVIIRGGGATDDLNSFDDPELARRVAMFPIPVIVGIGHERDRTVLDEIAHTRCKTPTAVAAFLIECLQNCEAAVTDLVNRIIDFARQGFMGERQRLAHIAAMLPLIAPGRIDFEKHKLDNIRGDMFQLSSALTHQAAERLTRLAARIETAAGNALTRPKERLLSYPEIIKRALESRLNLERERIDSRKGLIDVLSPASTLKRGYSITRINGKAVRSAANLPSGVEITTTFSDGEIYSVTK